MDENQLVMAEALAQSEIIEGIRRAKANIPKQPENFDGRCVDCDEELPAPRIKFGAVTCIHCQCLRELKLKIMRDSYR